MKLGIVMASVGAGLGTLGGGGLLVSHLLRDKVSDMLTKKGHEFLSFEEGKDLETWKTIAKAYADSTKNRLGTLKITITSGAATEQQAKDLKKACSDAINNKSYTEANLLSAEQWCVKPITIKNLISKHRTVLNLDLGTDQQQGEWDKKVDNYLADGAKNKLPETTLKTRANNDKAGDRKKLKTDCGKLTEKKTHDLDFHENFSQFQDWCTVPKSK